MKYSIAELKNMLIDVGIKPAATIDKTQLLFIAFENGLLKREELITRMEDEGKKIGRPRKYPPKEVDPNKVIDPKYEYLKTIRNKSRPVRYENINTGEVREFRSIYEAAKETKRYTHFFTKNDGKIVDGCYKVTML